MTVAGRCRIHETCVKAGGGRAVVGGFGWSRFRSSEVAREKYDGQRSGGDAGGGASNDAREVRVVIACMGLVRAARLPTSA